MFYSYPNPPAHIQQQDIRIARTTCENLIPQGQEIFKDVTEVFEHNKLFVNINLPVTIITLNVKPRYIGALWMIISQRDGSVDFKACSKDQTVSAKWVRMQHYTKKEWLNVIYD